MFTSLQVIPLRTGKFHESGLRVIFDVSFFVIITTILLGIVFSIILESFNDMREERVSRYIVQVYSMLT